MDQPEISFICPCFNSSHYLKKAIESFLGQETSFQTELILVINPSTDDTIAIAESYQDPRIRIILDPQNLSIVASRDVGIAAAKGRYIGFMDSDDYIDPHFVELMLGAAHKENADAVDCNYFILNDKTGKEKRFALRGPHKVVDSYGAVHLLLQDTSVRGFLCTKIFKRELLFSSSIRLPSPYMFEDMPIGYCAFVHAQKVAVLKPALYHYRKQVRSSATSAKRPDRALSHLLSFALIRIYADQSGDPRLVKEVRRSYLRMKLSLDYDLYCSRKAGLTRKEARAILKEFHLFKTKGPLPIAGKRWAFLCPQAFTK